MNTAYNWTKMQSIGLFIISLSDKDQKQSVELIHFNLLISHT